MAERCQCEHEPVPWLPFMKRVKVMDKGESKPVKKGEL